MRRDRKSAHLRGLIAEYLCMALLVCKGYSLLARRFRNAAGEIDIIAVKGKVLVFIEVKARTRSQDALESVTGMKQQRVQQAANGFVATHRLYAHHGLRFDVMVLTSLIRIYHHKDAWRP